MKFLIRTILLACFLLLFASESGFSGPRTTVVGRFRLRSPNGKFYGRTKTLVFLDPSNKKHSCNIKHKDSGFFSIRLPIGYNYLAEVHYSDGGDYFKKMPERYVEVKVDSADHIYYVGDIIMTWDIELKDELTRTYLGATFGIIGGIGDAIILNDRLKRAPTDAKPFTVTTERNTIARFAADNEVDTSAIIVSPVHPRK